MDKDIFRNIAGCYQNKNSSHTFFVGINPSTKKFKDIVPGKVTSNIVTI